MGSCDSFPSTGRGALRDADGRWAGTEDSVYYELDGRTNLTHMPDLDDLNHELYQIMRLHHEMRSWRWILYPKTMKRAADVAYAAHIRVLLEFFRNGRVNIEADLKRIGCPKPNDLKVSDVDQSWKSTKWTDEELERLCDADKLLGHLSKDRGKRVSQWGRDEDWALLRAHIDRLLSAVTTDLNEARQARGALS